MANCQCEYILGEDHHEQLQPTLAQLLLVLEDTERNNEDFFDFAWHVGSLAVATTEAGNRFQDAPRFRVPSGVSSRVVRTMVEDILRLSIEEVTRIRSITWNGEWLERDNVMKVEIIQVVEGDIPVIVDGTTERSVSPMEAQEDSAKFSLGEMIGDILPNFLLGTRPSVPLGPIALAKREGQRRFLGTLQNQRLITYTFEGKHIRKVPKSVSLHMRIRGFFVMDGLVLCVALYAARTSTVLDPLAKDILVYLMLTVMTVRLSRCMVHNWLSLFYFLGILYVLLAWLQDGPMGLFGPQEE